MSFYIGQKQRLRLRPTLLRRISNLESKLSCFFTKLICFKLLNRSKPVPFTPLNDHQWSQTGHFVIDIFVGFISSCKAQFEKEKTNMPFFFSFFRISVPADNLLV
jgi:hypothetical protein